ncbi:DUF4170 domain-containing protein [Candidatus Liberibacter asiaticus]|uniref:DUF4170 domain-containing protein n=2 Tax=Liberibacter asiaticus TaxID=34021 RepID=C6XHY3_LIBAP|nr:DUF4170 domain-containing protein [Candidatus Liberibacter asiaticus]ACT56876.1 hypothetical protein CLIBASIA_01440 [Candidatus Liberibacter asiaticus str. psy62]AGH16640.1 hypothetical protein WSI_01350 [Candidatus Liberibacter asiaticus str. gxpsy]ALK07028.1 DUF4170 domain-containing protein [Candidatus Liberibacter asiaticus]ASK52498.1 inositol monophosphatase [Candidatus Liberibacter asiaticus]AWL13822.1 DUF4170 domain-containing protein [Candidatus Liberibacter asiaticus]
MINGIQEEQVLYLVFGGELENITQKKMRNPDDIDVVGIFSSYSNAYDVWKEKSQQMVDNALMRYFVVDISRFPHYELGKE